jgi:3D (Asp-Asp-Asp) domain-containing protein
VDLEFEDKLKTKKTVVFVTIISVLVVLAIAFVIDCKHNKSNENQTEETKVVYEVPEDVENSEATKDTATHETETTEPTVIEPIVTEPVITVPTTTEPTKETTETTKDEADKDEWVSLGMFKITFYCTCEKCNGKWHGYPTASGTDYVEGRTIAVDKSIIKLGTKVKIKGWGTYVAEDTGVKGKHIDIFLNDHKKCYEYGTQRREVWVKK